MPTTNKIKTKQPGHAKLSKLPSTIFYLCAWGTNTVDEKPESPRKLCVPAWGTCRHFQAWAPCGWGSACIPWAPWTSRPSVRTGCSAPPSAQSCWWLHAWWLHTHKLSSVMLSPENPPPPYRSESKGKVTLIVWIMKQLTNPVWREQDYLQQWSN